MECCGFFSFDFNGLLSFVIGFHSLARLLLMAWYRTVIDLMGLIEWNFE